MIIQINIPDQQTRILENFQVPRAYYEWWETWTQQILMILPNWHSQEKSPGVIGRPNREARGQIFRRNGPWGGSLSEPLLFSSQSSFYLLPSRLAPLLSVKVRPSLRCDVEFDEGTDILHQPVETDNYCSLIASHSQLLRPRH